MDPAYPLVVGIQTSYVAEVETETEDDDDEAELACMGDVHDLAAFDYHWDLHLQVNFEDNAYIPRWETQLVVVVVVGRSCEDDAVEAWKGEEAKDG